MACLARRKHGHAANVASACYRLGAGVDVARLEQAIARLPALVPALGCAVREEDGELVLVTGVHPQLASRRLVFADPAAAPEEALGFAAIDADTPFQVREQALVRSTLMSLPGGETWWQLSCHALVADVRGCEALFNAVAVLYGASSEAGASRAQSCDQDASGERLAYPDSDAFQHDLRYWRAQALQIAHERSAAGLRKGQGDGARWLTLTQPLPLAASALAALARRLSCDSETLFAAATLALLHRIGGASTVSVGLSQCRTQATVAGQVLATEPDTVALGLEVEGEDSFAALLERSAALLARSRLHRRFPQHLLIDFNHSRKEHEQRLFDLSVYHEVLHSSAFGAGPAERIALPYRGDHLPRLGLVCDDSADSAVLRLDFPASALDRDQARGLLASLACLLEHVAASAGQAPVSALNLVAPADRATLLGAWSGHANDSIPHCCVHQLFERQAAATPDAPALVFEGDTLSYAQLNRRAAVLARLLRERGVAPGTLVGLFVGRSATMVVALLAILKAGGAFVPLDIDFPDARLRYIIDDAALPLILTEAALCARLPEAAQRRALALDGIDWSIAAPAQAQPGQPGATPADLAYVIYTSGTTGNPKGVLIEHAGVVNLAYGVSADLEIDAASRVLQFAALTFDAAICELVISFVRGATVYLASQAERLSPELLSALVHRAQITHAILPPVLLKYLSREQFASVRQLSVVGESTPLETARLWAEGRRLINGYGPTENTVCATQSVFDGVSLNIGRPIHNVRCYVLDQHNALVPVGAPGELCVGGAGVARGYLNQPALTAAKFIPDCFSGAGRLYKTGDLVRWLPDGNLEFVGRRDQQVKIRGLRVELEEVEANIEAIAGVGHGTVLVRELPPAAGAEPEKCLVAYVVLNDVQLGVAQLRQALAQRVPAYMIPAFFVILERFPLTHNRKIDRKKLLELPLER